MRTIPESIAAHNGPPADGQVVLVLTTWPEDGTGTRIARDLVETGAAACVTRLPPHEVTYRWQGVVEEATERQWVIKTTRGALGRLWEAVRAAHPYDTPEWLVLDVREGSEAYMAWVRAATAL